jgi:hypothetical protein
LLLAVKVGDCSCLYHVRYSIAYLSAPLSHSLCVLTYSDRKCLLMHSLVLKFTHNSLLVLHCQPCCLFCNIVALVTRQCRPHSIFVLSTCTLLCFSVTYKCRRHASSSPGSGVGYISIRYLVTNSANILICSWRFQSTCKCSQYLFEYFLHYYIL